MERQHNMHLNVTKNLGAHPFFKANTRRGTFVVDECMEQVDKVLLVMLK